MNVGADCAGSQSILIALRNLRGNVFWEDVLLDSEVLWLKEQM